MLRQKRRALDRTARTRTCYKPITTVKNQGHSPSHDWLGRVELRNGRNTKRQDRQGAISAVCSSEAFITRVAIPCDCRIAPRNQGGCDPVTFTAWLDAAERRSCSARSLFPAFGASLRPREV